MSVNDPVIRDLKGCLQHLWEEFKTSGKITDESNSLILFCQKLETVFYSGLVPTKFIFLKTEIEPFTWLTDITKNKNISFGFSYANSVEAVQNNKYLTTKIGKFRSLIRHCLNGKCLHVPVEYLLKFGDKNVYYQEDSILGDEILIQIFYSILLQSSNFRFELDLENFYFLDVTWDLPEALHLEVLPSDCLGLAISFSEEKAVVVDIDPFGPVGDDGRVRIGDILESINGIKITPMCKNKLKNLMKSNRYSPLNLTIIKAIRENKALYPPIRKYLIDVNLDVSSIQNRDKEDIDAKNNTSVGFKCVYVGCTRLGHEFEAKQVERTIRNAVKYRYNAGVLPCTRYNQPVTLVIGELGLLVLEDEKVLFDHSYTEISSCNSSTIYTNYFGYIKRNERTEGVKEEFTCYIFYTKNRDEMLIILSSIGQGFKRTHYAV